ncbi:unnamed protein product [Paramecium sonneborni]|uniref:Uncharacterized protein n=1 Tax=Paramecium sonneborni TaxID=65129 RepID=A0A8S1PER1_9CILI|nr:unnamed protein product [Paramecium sonneborni]
MLRLQFKSSTGLLGSVRYSIFGIKIFLYNQKVKQEYLGQKNEEYIHTSMKYKDKDTKFTAYYCVSKNLIMDVALFRLIPMYFCQKIKGLILGKITSQTAQPHYQQRKNYIQTYVKQFQRNINRDCCHQCLRNEDHIAHYKDQKNLYIFIKFFHIFEKDSEVKIKFDGWRNKQTFHFYKNKD